MLELFSNSSYVFMRVDSISLKTQSALLDDIIQFLYSDENFSSKIKANLILIESNKSNPTKKIQASNDTYGILTEIQKKLITLHEDVLLGDDHISLNSNTINNYKSKGWIKTENAEELVLFFKDIVKNQLDLYQFRKDRYTIENNSEQCDKIFSKKKVHLQEEKFTQQCDELSLILNLEKHTVFTIQDLLKAKNLFSQAQSIHMDHGRIHYFQWKILVEEAVLKNASFTVDYDKSHSLLESAINASEDFPEKDNASLSFIRLEKEHKGKEAAKTCYKNLLDKGLLKNLTEHESLKNLITDIFYSEPKEEETKKITTHPDPISSKTYNKQNPSALKPSDNQVLSAQAQTIIPTQEELKDALKNLCTEKYKLARQYKMGEIETLNYSHIIKQCLKLTLNEEVKSQLIKSSLLHSFYLLLADCYQSTKPQLAYDYFKKAADLVNSSTSPVTFETIEKLHTINDKLNEQVKEEEKYSSDFFRKLIEKFTSSPLLPDTAITELMAMMRICSHYGQKDLVQLIRKATFHHKDYLVTYNLTQQMQLRWQITFHEMREEKQKSPVKALYLARPTSTTTSKALFSQNTPRYLNASTNALPSASLEAIQEKFPEKSSSVTVSEPMIKKKTEKDIDALNQEIQNFSSDSEQYIPHLLKRNHLCLDVIKEKTNNKKDYLKYYENTILDSTNWIIDPSHHCSTEQVVEAYIHQAKFYEHSGEMSIALARYKEAEQRCMDSNKKKAIQKEIKKCQTQIEIYQEQSRQCIGIIREKIGQKKSNIISIFDCPDSKIKFNHVELLIKLTDEYIIRCGEAKYDFSSMLKKLNDEAINLLSDIKEIDSEDTFNIAYTFSILLRDESSEVGHRYLSKCLTSFNHLSSIQKDKLADKIVDVHHRMSIRHRKNNKYSLFYKHMKKYIESERFNKSAKHEKEDLLYQCLLMAEVLKQNSAPFREQLKSLNATMIRPEIYALLEDAHKQYKEGKDPQKIMSLYDTITDMLDLSFHAYPLVFERIIFFCIGEGDNAHAIELAKAAVDLLLSGDKVEETLAPIACQYVRLLLQNIPENEEAEKFQHAETVLLRAIDIAPESAEVHFELGWLYQLCGLTEKANMHYQKILELEDVPQKEYIALAQGHMALLKQNYSNAVTHYESCRDTLTHPHSDVDVLFQENYHACLEYAHQQNNEDKEQDWVKAPSLSPVSLGTIHCGFSTSPRNGASPRIETVQVKSNDNSPKFPS